MPTKARVIAKSKSLISDEILTTFEVEFPRVILAEVNTYRNGITRNYQSSRAVNLAKQRELIRTDPYEPIDWLANQTGMSGGAELTGWRLWLAKRIWRKHRKQSLRAHWALDKLGLHKQWTNRLTETHGHIKGIITVNHTCFQHMYEQRVAQPGAQPEILKLVACMARADRQVEAREIGIGQWHIPYFEELAIMGYDMDSTLMLEASAVCCAQVSYRNFNPDRESVERISHKLIAYGHLTPWEHVATPYNPVIYNKLSTFESFDTIRARLERGAWNQ